MQGRVNFTKYTNMAKSKYFFHSDESELCPYVSHKSFEIGETVEKVAKFFHSFKNISHNKAFD